MRRVLIQTLAVSQFRVCILQRLHFKAIYVTQLSNAARRLSQFKGSSKCNPQMLLLLHHYYPSCPHISQDSLHTGKIRKKGRKWWYRVALIVTFAGLGSRNHDIRVKHLVTQPGNAPKARLSHLTMVAVVNKVSPKHSPSNTAKAGSFEGCRPWIETRQLSCCEGDTT